MHSRGIQMPQSFNQVVPQDLSRKSKMTTSKNGPKFTINRYLIFSFFKKALCLCFMTFYLHKEYFSYKNQCCGSELVSMRIRIFISMRIQIRIQGQINMDLCGSGSNTGKNSSFCDGKSLSRIWTRICKDQHWFGWSRIRNQCQCQCQCQCGSTTLISFPSHPVACTRRCHSCN